ncbi:hypothetical protein AMTRI_Chr10g1240 [Amborella trichopoda]
MEGVAAKRRSSTTKERRRCSPTPIPPAPATTFIRGNSNSSRNGGLSPSTLMELWYHLPIPYQPPLPPPPLDPPYASSQTSFTLSQVSVPVEELKTGSNLSISVDHHHQYKQKLNQQQQHKKALVAAVRRPDSGGEEGLRIPLLANHFLVRFDPLQTIFHYNVDISPRPTKEVARLIKRKLFCDNPSLTSSAAFDGRTNLYSPSQFRKDRLEFFVALPIPSKMGDTPQSKPRTKLKFFRVNMKLASKLDGQDLERFLRDVDHDEEEEDANCGVPLPQDYLHALDVVLRENPVETCIPVGRSLYSSSIGGGAKDIGGGAVGLRGFFQSLRPTEQGLALNVDFAVTAFHESIGIIQFLQKRCEFLRDLSQRKSRGLVGEERREVEKALRNIRVFVSHRVTDQRYKVFSLTEESTENLRFKSRGGEDISLVDYFKENYNHDIQFRKLPCLQMSRSKPCYIPMELCVICEGQKFMGKLSDEQTARILKMGCQKPWERRAIINGVMGGPVGPTSGNMAIDFNLHISREMTRLTGRVLQPPKLKLGDGGRVTDLIPTRHDCQWNLLESHVLQGARIERWAIISFGGTPEQRSSLPKFIIQLAHRCEQLGVALNKVPTVAPQFEPMQALNSVSSLESKLRKIHELASNRLQLLICVMERKHRGYADLKRISETSIGIVSQCCLYQNLMTPGSQFLANLALKINAKTGGCTVALYNSLPAQMPRVFGDSEPAIFMGADVTHPHPLDDHSPSVAAIVGSMNWPSPNKYASRMRSQTHRQEIIEDLGQMVEELLFDFYREVNKLPKRILFFRDGVSETQFYTVLHEELPAIRAACSRLKLNNHHQNTKGASYNPAITFVVVQKRHHTRLFQATTNPQGLHSVGNNNIPPGTVVDRVITHPREFDFYLCSHWGTKGTSRPTHYHVLWDENCFSSDELQKLVYSLCFTSTRCTKPVSLVPPAYYAHLAAYRGRLYLDKPPSLNGGGSGSLSPDYSVSFTPSRAGPPPQAAPLPRLAGNLKNLMFYC